MSVVGMIELLVKGLAAGVVVAGATFLSVWLGQRTGDVVLAAQPFSLALWLVLYLRLELFNGNCLTMAPAIAKRVGWQWPAYRLLTLFLLNLGGAILMGQWLWLKWAEVDLAFQEKLISVAIYKMNLSWHEMLVKGFICNACICGAVLASWWFKNSRWKLVKTTLMIILLVTTFVVAGGEHVVVNFTYVSVIALAGKFSWLGLAKLLLAGVGNLGGGLLVIMIAKMSEARQPIWRQRIQ